MVVVCLREPLAADTLSRSRYAGYASRYPLLPARAPSCRRAVRQSVPLFTSWSRRSRRAHTLRGRASRSSSPENQSVRLTIQRRRPFGAFRVPTWLPNCALPVVIDGRRIRLEGEGDRL